ncbi:hypothetical protein Gotur_028494 [Gossypium turneri]
MMLSFFKMLVVAVMNSLHQLLLGQSLMGIVPRWFIWLALLKLNKDSSVPIQVGSRLMLMVLFKKKTPKQRSEELCEIQMGSG